MSLFDGILGDGQDRPPAPEVASPEDVERYNLEFLKHNDVEPRQPDVTDPEEAPFAKAADREDGEVARNTKHKTEFPWLDDPSRGVRWDFNPVSLRNLAQPNTWVGMLVGSITKEIAETPCTIVGADDRQETQKRLTTHPEERTPVRKDLPDRTAEDIYDLLMRPNPDETWHDLVEQWVADLLEIGSMTAVKAFHRSAYDGEDFTGDARQYKPRALQASAPEVWTKDYHKSGIIDGYWQFENHSSPGAGSTDGTQTGVRGIRDPTFYDSVEVMWADHSPRTNRRYGLPPTLHVREFLESVDLAITQEQQYLSRGSIPSGAWVFEQWDREQLKERRTQMQENVKGKPHKSLMFAGQGGDVSFEPMSMNFQELEFTERVKWYARVIASAFQVPTAVVGIEPERVNYNTFQGERENFESNTLGPYLQKLERWITHAFIRPHWGAGYRFEFMPGMSESTRGMISDRVTKEFRAGLRRRNEARREVGLDPVDEAFDGFQDEVVEDTSPEDAQDALGDLMASTMDSDDGEGGDSVAKGDPTRENHEVDPGAGVGYCANTDKEFECETMADLAGDCPHCGEPISHIDPEDLDKSDGGSGNADVRKDEPLRETDAWWQFDVQPHMVEDLTDAIADDVQALFDEVLEDDEIRQVIDRLAAEDDSTEKSLAALSRRLRELFDESDVVARIQSALQDETADAVRETVEASLAEATDAEAETDVDIEAIEAQLRDRSVTFADSFADELADDIRETVGEGWAEGKGTREIADDIAEQADINSGWTGAERIARQELHIASGEARKEVAADLDKVRVWQTSQDGRVRPAHERMEGQWARPGESWEVEYENNVVVEESVPGSSEHGIGCRCTELLRDIETVDDADHAGV